MLKPISKAVALGLTTLLALPPLVLAQEPDDDTPQVEDVIVVTATRTEQRLQEVPVAMTVISAEQLANTPADDYGDVLRSVPGLNVSQMSARDVQIAGRSATSSLSNNQLVLLDGRTVYLDFFGFVMWDLLPVDFREISQIEAVRGPGSAVWGANALGGVVNLITKSPWELTGTALTLGGGELGSLYGNVSHATAGDDWGFKISAAYSEQDPYDRPTGIVPGSDPPTPYPDFVNEGTEQPKVDLRFDKTFANGEQYFSGSVGWAETDGIVHSGIGPFDIQPGSGLNYFNLRWSKGVTQVNVFGNFLDGSATNLLTVGADLQPLLFDFVTDTLNIDFSNSEQIGRHTLTYGGNYRHIEFELSIASDDSREEVGIFFQDEIELSDTVTWLVGARWDDIDPVGDVVSPRTSLLISPSPNHNFRISYNEAFRAPSLVENFLDTTIVNAIDLGPILDPFLRPFLGPLPSIPYFFPSLAVGNAELQEEKLTAYEVGYVGTFNGGRTTFTAAIYRNELEDGSDFFQNASYNPFNPPPGWAPFPINLLDPLTQLGLLVPLNLPSSFSYRNIGERIDEGIELSLDYRPSPEWHFSVNYSHQAEPELTGVDITETNIAPENRFNLALSWNGDKWFADSTVNYVDEARWTDVLDSRFWGTTDDYTVVNLSIGVRLNDTVTLSVLGNNIFDEDVQQHIFGDIISRKIVGQVRFEF
ncbi:MAG: TonB-dependent receptor [Acidobacteriota bacterium]